MTATDLDTLLDDTEAPAPATLRVFAGGFLMGVANLVPGVSGGTMILALGLYDRFIQVVADVTRLRWSGATLRFLALVVGGAALAFLGLSGPAVWLVTEHRWIAYSLFVGMTLGGVPELWKVVRPFGAAEAVPALGGFAVMAAFAWGLDGAALPPNAVVLALVGALAASSMILPGISGSYILLIFGLYDVVVGSIRPRELLNDLGGSLGVLVPVAVGVALGIGGLSNVLKLLLARFERPTHAALLGLLVGAVLGLWPFQESVHPALSSKERRVAVERLLADAPLADIAAETGVELDAGAAAALRERYAGLSRGELKLRGLELQRYRPAPLRAGLAVLLFALGVAVTRLLGAREPRDA